jgi:hypothetical protein
MHLSMVEIVPLMKNMMRQKRERRVPERGELCEDPGAFYSSRLALRGTISGDHEMSTSKGSSTHGNMSKDVMVWHAVRSCGQVVGVIRVVITVNG